MGIARAFEPSPFAGPGTWVRASFHCHTTNSDGGLGVEETVRLYRERGIQCLGISDHRSVTPVEAYSEGDFLAIDATENGGMPDVLAVGVREAVPEGLSLAQRAARLAAQGGFTVGVHPHYCAAYPTDYASCEHLHAIEIYNAYCDIAYSNGLATEMWDMVLGLGKRVWGVAGDDAHLNPRKRYYSDAGLGWVAVWTPALARDEVLAALKRGAFYSTQGPEFREFEVAGGDLRITCSPVVQVRWRTFGSVGFVDYPAPGQGALTASALPDWFRPRGYVRVELVDAAGKRAWSNPFFLEK